MVSKKYDNVRKEAYRRGKELYISEGWTKEEIKVLDEGAISHPYFDSEFRKGNCQYIIHEKIIHEDGTFTNVRYWGYSDETQEEAMNREFLEESGNIRLKSDREEDVTDLYKQWKALSREIYPGVGKISNPIEYDDEFSDENTTDVISFHESA